MSLGIENVVSPPSRGGWQMDGWLVSGLVQVMLVRSAPGPRFGARRVDGLTA